MYYETGVVNGSISKIYPWIGEDNIRMKKQFMLGAIIGICLTEILQYFAPRSEILFYCYIFTGAVTASIISRSIVCGTMIAGYVIAWKVVGMLFLMRTYGVQAIAGSFSPFLIDWVFVFLVGIAGGYVGEAIGKHVGRHKNTAAS